MRSEDLNQQILKRKYRVVYLLATLFLVIIIFTSVFEFINFFKHSSLELFIKLILLVLCGTLFSYLRFYLISKKLTLSFFILITFPLLIAIFIIFTKGVSSFESSLLLITIILATSIVVDIRSTVIISVLIVLAILIIIFIQIGHLSTYTLPFTLTDFFDTLLLIFFILLITFIIYLGYSQIEDAYSSAYKYSRRLEELNNYLDEKVKLRTKQLQQSFEKQAESVHGEAIMGSIAQPLLHDLSAPVSALDLAFNLFQDNKFKEDKNEIISRAKESLKQIIRIISNGRDLMSKKSTKIIFKPSDIITTVSLVLKDKLHKGEINLMTDVEDNVQIEGIPVLFERIVINVVLNAVEELARSEKKDKTVSIKGSVSNNFFILEITDNGRGIKKDLINKIFENNFSLKGETNLGFGLPFVRNTIEKYFDGHISVESVEGEYTKFVLSFHKPDKFNQQEAN